jgi:hypothetical protein
MVVVGEDSLRATIDSLLGSVTELVLHLEGDASGIAVQLDQIEALLDRPEWAVVDQTMAVLDEKVVTQDVVIANLQRSVDDWRSKLEPAQQALAAALAANAPVPRERAALERMSGLVAAADRGLTDHRYASVSDSIRRLDGGEDPAELRTRIETKVAHARRFGRHAEILLLRTVVDKVHSYTVLLRTPSEPGTHGINIQDSSDLVTEDRQYLREIVSDVTRTVDAGIERSFRERAAAGRSGCQHISERRRRHRTQCAR